MIRAEDKKVFEEIIAQMRIVAKVRKNKLVARIATPLQVLIGKDDLREMTGRSKIRDSYLLEVVGFLKTGNDDIMAQMYEGDSILVQLADPVHKRSYNSVAELFGKK